MFRSFRGSIIRALPSHLVTQKYDAAHIMRGMAAKAPALPFEATVPEVYWACAVAIRDASEYQRTNLSDVIVAPAAALLDAYHEVLKLKAISEDVAEQPEMKAMALEELETVTLPDVGVRERALVEALDNEVPLDSTGIDSDVWTIEIKGAVGGAEAWLFAGDLHGMYKAFCGRQGWDYSDMSERDEEPKVFSLRITGRDVKRSLQYEVGVHRVQRIPVTEASGRMQTSTAIVTLMPQIKMQHAGVKESDCELSMTHGSGPGGQAVNTSFNCVRLVHKPSGIHIRCHATRSATNNKTIAYEMLAQRLWERKCRDEKVKLSSLLGEQWASGERNEKIRTYNDVQNRVTDHRLETAVTDYPAVMEGGDLTPFHSPLLERDDAADKLNAVVKFANSLAPKTTVAEILPEKNEKRR